MAFTVIQAGTSLQLLDTSGALATLTLPTGVTLSSTLKPRFTVYGRYVVLVNSPSRPLSIDGSGTVRVLTPAPPVNIPILSGVTAGGLTGTYQVKYTYLIQDVAGNIISESGFSPTSAAVTISAKMLRVSNISLSPDPQVTATRFYRTTTLGTTYFPWFDLPGNTQTTFEDDLPDASLGEVAAGPLGSAPDLTLIVNYKERLFGVGRTNPDDLVYTETGLMYDWSALDDQPISPVGADAQGVTGLIPRRNALGIGKSNKLRQLTGDSADDFAIVNLTENAGISAQESVVVVDDTAYWLWQDGVYRWDANGVTCITDGKVRSWFTTNLYFNRAQYSQAFAVWIPDRNVYRLFLVGIGATTVNRFLDYDIATDTWWGPHKTDAFTPTSGLVRSNSDGIAAATVGSADGYLWQEQAVRTDGAATPIALSITTTGQDADEPTLEKVFTNLRIANVPQPGGQVLVTPRVGELNAQALGQSLALDLTQANQRVGRIGRGKTVTLTFANAVAGQDVQLLGYEIDVAAIGRR